MKTKLLFLLILQISFGSIYAQKFESTRDKKINRPIVLVESGKQENIYIPARKQTNTAKANTTTFNINYNGFSDEAKEAFEAAADVWCNLIQSNVPITIDAYWVEMDEGVLGSSGSPEMFKNFPNAPYKNTWYKPTVANRLAGYDLNPDEYDMVIRYNKNASWYLGTDGNPGSLTDFVSVVIHEIGHGLGFSDGFWVDGTDGGNGYVDDNGENQSPVVFDQFIVNGSDELLIDTNNFKNPSAELYAEITSNDVYFSSPLVNEANGGDKAEIYAPSTWSSGSSMAHMGEVYNSAGADALMTYSIGTGEAIHDAGPVTMAIFAEVGWLGVRFDHDALNDIEAWSAPRTVSAKIYADTSLYDNSVILHYSIDKFDADDNTVIMATSDDIEFTADIPVIADDTVWYYIEAKSKIDRYYYYPSQGTGSISTTFSDSAFYFISGADNIKPQIVHENDNKFIFDVDDNLDIEAEADDNIGIDSVYIEYMINENTAKYINFTLKEENPTGLPLYNVELPLNEETLNNGDTLYYRIHAVDSSSNTNSATSPATGYYKVPIYEIYAPVKDTVIDFDDSKTDDLFVFDGLTLDQPSNFSSKGLHSPHPYEEGDNHPGNEINYSAILQIPIILDDDSTKISFDEIVIVEPGSTGNVFGDPEFWDYVIIEGSKDTGKTWVEFEDGYDCSISSTFTTAFNNETNGDESMYLNHKINLLTNDYFEAGDTVLIRFRLWSDQLTVGWGWAVDNVQIQKEEVIAPSTPGTLATTEITDTTISLIWNKSTDNVGVTGYLVYKNDAFLEEVTDTTYKVMGLTKATEYDFYVIAIDAVENESEKSNVVTATTTNLTSVEVVDMNNSKIKLYPNPAKDFINIQYESKDIIGDISISIYSLDGKLIYTKSKSVGDKSYNEQLNIENIKKGYYILKLSSGKDVITNRFIVR